MHEKVTVGWILCKYSKSYLTLEIECLGFNKNGTFKISQKLKNITAINRKEYDWFLSMDYNPHGILPDIYGENYHGIVLIKRL